MIPVPPPAPAEPSGGARPKTWRCGTLTYTSTGLFILFLWLLWGDFAWAMNDRSTPGVVQLLLKKFHASDTLAGVLMGSLPALLGVIVGPIISYKSDRHRGRLGRRIPFLLVIIPVAVLGMVSLAFSPRIGALLHQALGALSPGLNPSILFSFSVSWTLFGFAAIVINFIFGALINDVVPREVLGRFYGAFRALSLIAGMIFNFWMFGIAETYYVWIFLGMATLYGVGFTLMCLKVKEGEYPAIVPMDVGRDTKGFIQAARTYLQESFSNPYYQLYFITMGISWQSFAPINLFYIFYAEDIHMNLTVLGRYVTLTYLISLGLSYPLGMLVDRFHPLRVSLVVLFLYVLVTLPAGLFIRGATSFAIAWVAHGVLSGAWFTAVASLGQRLLPKAEFAQFASAGFIVSSVCTILVATATGAFLDHMHHVYRHIFDISCGIAVVSVILGVALHGKFMALGGPKNYVAPEGLAQRPL